ncbi:MAG: polysaccharide deacetylase family protein [Oscillospiraceae bacterium]|nr:polysaccharide deacetylase family protein [Oscillospiraceae bacterium]
MNFMRRLTALLLVFAMCFSLLTGCGKKEHVSTPDASTSAETSSSQSVDASDEGDASASSQPTEEGDASQSENNGGESEEAEESGTAAPVGSPYDYTVKMDVTNVDFAALKDLNNEAIPYGFSTKNRDDLNRPDGIYYYDNIYGEYGGITHINTEDKLVYLTMDEGYENGCTPEILDTLKEKGVKAVFFITKQFYDEQPALIQRMIDEGHIVGNHTCAHPAGGMPQLGAQAEYDDIKWLNDAVYDTFGYQMRLFRYPEGVSSKQSIALLNMMGYRSIFWSFAYRDFDLNNQMDTGEALSQCLDQVHPGAIYLLHAVSTTNTAILGDWIDGVREKGYDFGVFPVDVN